MSYFSPHTSVHDGQQITSTTRLGTPPQATSSLSAANGEITASFSYLLHPNPDLDRFQQHVERSTPTQAISNRMMASSEYSSSLLLGTDDLSVSPKVPDILRGVDVNNNYANNLSPSMSNQCLSNPSPHHIYSPLPDLPVPDIIRAHLNTGSTHGTEPNIPADLITETSREPLPIPSPPQPYAMPTSPNQSSKQSLNPNEHVISLSTIQQARAQVAENNNTMQPEELQRRYNADSIRSIVRAQALMRGWIQRVRARKQLMLQAWHELDTKEEQELALNNAQYKDLRTLVDQGTAESVSPKQKPQAPPALVKKSENVEIDIFEDMPEYNKDVVIQQQKQPSPEPTYEAHPQHEIKPHQNVYFDENAHQTVVASDDADVHDIIIQPAVSTTSSRGRVENGLYRPASGLAFAEPTNDDGIQISLSDLNIPSSAAVVTSVYGESDNPNTKDWVDKVQTRMRQLQLLREFRQHAVPHPSTSTPSTKRTLNGPLHGNNNASTSYNDIDIDWVAVDNMTGDTEYFFNQAPQFRTRLGKNYNISKSIIDKYPRASLRPITSTTPIDIDWVMNLRDELANGKIPSANIIERIILIAFSLLVKEPNVNDCVVPLRGKVTVVGDIHGQYQDLLCIFRINGPPSGNNYYIFNGDWVDRGSQSIEVLLLILAWKICFPNFVFLNRGNHEAADLNSRDGFEVECKNKYGVGLFPLFSELFSAVPIACRIFGSPDPNVEATNKPKPAIFVTHGGIPQFNLTIAQIQEENRFHKIPPSNSIIFNMLWSDPSHYKGLHPSSRGAGVEFGPDVTLNFLRKNQCCMLIRSHECVNDGWALSQNSMCLTAFSASNYCGIVGNQGAIVIIESTLRPTLVTYYAEKSSNVRSSIHFRRLESSVVRKLMDRIALHRLDLISYYRNVAKDNVERALRGETAEQILNTHAAIPCSDEVISRQQWADGLRETLGLNIPFLLFQESLGLNTRGILGDEFGPINFMNFLTPFTPKHGLFTSFNNSNNSAVSQASTEQIPVKCINQIMTSHDGSQFQVTIEYDANGEAIVTPELSHLTLQQLAQLLYTHRYEVESVFRFLDYDNNGSVTRDEFILGIYSLIVLFRAKVQKMSEEKHPDCAVYANQSSLLLKIDWTKEKLKYLAEIVDVNNDNEIQYNEFMQHFIFDATSQITTTSSSTMKLLPNPVSKQKH